MATGLLKELNIIIYPSPDQQYESNIGLFEQESYALPTFIIKGSRVVVSYNGSYEQLKVQLYEAVVRAIWEAQVKESLGDQAKGSAGKEDIPFWFKEGAIRYFAHKWPLHAEDQLLRSFRKNDFQNWQQVIAYQPRLSGQAFCYFLTERYYPLAVTQLYQQLKKKNLQRSARLVTKRSLDSLYIQCFAFYKSRLEAVTDTSSKDSIHIAKKTGVLRNVLVSPEGQYIAYAVTLNGKRTIYSYNIHTKSNSKITSYPLPPWLNDHSTDPYPLLEWADASTISVFRPYKGKHVIKHYNAAGGTQGKDVLLGIDGINSFQQQEENNYLLSAYRRGQSDIVTYDAVKLQYRPYTSDRYDDAHPTGNKGQLFFSSQRPDTISGLKDSIKQRQGIYILKEGKVLPFVTDTTAYIRWDKPFPLPDGRLLATNTMQGSERFTITPSLQQPEKYQILSQYEPYQYLTNEEKIAFYQSSGSIISITKQPVQQWIDANRHTDTTKSPWLHDYERRKAEDARIDSMLRAARDEEPSFLEQVLMPKNAKERAQRREDSIINTQAYHPKKVKPYVLQLHSAYFSARVNNDYFINRYQPYINYQGQFKFPEVSGMVQGGFTDLLENHHINIAFRLPVGSEGSDFFVRYENKAKKWDWGAAYFRKVESLRPDPKRHWVNEDGKLYPNTAKVKTHYYELSAKYPITYELSAGIQTAVRQDRTIFLATEQHSLTFEDIKSIWSINTLSLNWNKLTPTIPLLYKGVKVRGLVDVFKAFSQKQEIVMGSTVKLEYHQPVYRYITIVAQAQAGFSAGQGKVLYNMGQVDNTLTPRIDSNVHFPQESPYAFQTLATPLRGHLQNSMYGDRYVLLNADVYFPIFQTLIPMETPLQFINLLQLGMFVDGAAAKESWNKIAPDRGWAWSYGLSAKTQLAGYPLRFDIAWPGTFNSTPLWYLSLSLN